MTVEPFAPPPSTALRADLQRMIHLAKQSLADAVTALQTGDAALAQCVIVRDALVNAQSGAIEVEALCLVGCARPAGSELRFVATAFQIATDIERIGDHAVSVARTAIRLDDAPASTPFPPELSRMARIALRLLCDLADAYGGDGEPAAQRVGSGEEEMDVAYQEAQSELRCRMRCYPNESVAAMHLLFVAHYLERIGDHCAHAAARLDYVRTGRVLHS